MSQISKLASGAVCLCVRSHMSSCIDLRGLTGWSNPLGDLEEAITDIAFQLSGLLSRCPLKGSSLCCVEADRQKLRLLPEVTGLIKLLRGHSFPSGSRNKGTTAKKMWWIY